MEGLIFGILRYSICSEKQLLPPQSRFSGFPFKSWFWNVQTVVESFSYTLQRFQRTCTETPPTEANTNPPHLRQPLQLLLLRYFFNKELFLCLQTVDLTTNFFKRPFFCLNYLLRCMPVLRIGLRYISIKFAFNLFTY